MPKRVATKKKPFVRIKKKSSSKSNITKVNVDKVLIENFIALQKIMTNFATKFDELSTQISKLLELFEISAKTLAEKDIKLNKGMEAKEEKKMTEKLDTLLDQNKIIARGLSLLHEPPTETAMRPPQQFMRPPMPSQPSPVKSIMDTGGYQKSMPTKNQERLNPNSPRLTKKNGKTF